MMLNKWHSMGERMENKKINDDKWISILISVLFVFVMFAGFINNITNLIYPNWVDTAVCYLVLFYLIAKALIPIIKRLTQFDFLALAVIAFVFFSTAVIFRGSNIDYIIALIPRFLTVILPYFLLGRVIRDFDILYKYLKYSLIAAALLGAGCYLILYISGQVIIEDDMAFAYFYLPSTIFLMFEFFRHFSMKNLILFLISLATLLMTGTRGPIVCLLAAMILYFIWYERSKPKKIILFFIVCLIVFFVISGLFYDLLYQLDIYLQNIGINNRIITKILNNELLDSSGRDIIQDRVISAIKSNFFFGTGIMGDRVAAGGSYAHNIVLELLCQYGLIFGSALLLAIIGLLTKTFRRCDSQYKKLLFMILVCSGFVKLLFSSSYIEDSSFAMLIGVSFNIIHTYDLKSREQRLRKPEIIYENM